MTPASSLKQLALDPIDSIDDAEQPPVSTSSLHRTTQSSLHVWEYAPGTYEWQTDDTHCACVLSGAAEVRLSDGRNVRLQPGSTLYIPPGMRGVWEVESTLRTVALHHANA